MGDLKVGWVCTLERWTASRAGGVLRDMKTLASLAVLFCLSLMVTGTAHAGGGSVIHGIPAGSKIFLDDRTEFAGDFGTALLRKRVPVVIVETLAEADYILEAQASVENQSFWKTIFVMPVSAAHASIELKSRTGRLVFAYAVDRSLVIREQKSTAESCAKKLKEIVY